MGTTPARMTPEGAPVSILETGTQDTERPPPITPPSSSDSLNKDEKTDADVGARLAGLNASFGHEPASGVAPMPPLPATIPGESTKVGPPPDPGTPIGPPTPRGLKAALPVRPALPSPPKLAAAVVPFVAERPTVNRPAAPPLAPGRNTGARMPLDPIPTPSVPHAAPVVAPLPPPLAPPGPPGVPRRPPSRSDGTVVGIAPLAAGAAPAPTATATTTTTTTPTGDDVALTRRCTSCNELYPADFLVCPRDATPLVAADGTEAPDPLVGSLIGETYQIVRTIGEGGMGRVYEARHLRLKERRFAVKCLHADLARNPDMAARFLREAESASSIKHSNVVDVFDVHHLADGTPYLVGEYLEGEELADYVAKRGPLDPRIAAKVARQVCNALAAAHERGIVHRDMKPENIFVLLSSISAVDQGTSRTLHVKVLDFGISKAGHGDKSHLTKTGVIMGTPSYMSPEQARGRPVDLRADIYSLGACLYFMVTGRRPFDSDDPTSTLSMVLTEDPVRPREIDERIPEHLELIIQRAMAKDANDRYASMGELEKALASVMGSNKASIAIPSGHGASMVPAITNADVAAIQTSGAQRAFDVAKVMLGSGSLPPQAQQSGNLARAARPTIVVTSGALGAWMVGGTVAALAGLVRVLHDGEVTLTESLLLVVGCLFAAATPIALYVMHLRKVIWPNSVRALQLATDLKRMTVAALVTYGGLSIIGRIVHTVFWRSSRGLASGVWDIALFLASVAVALTIGGFTPLLRNLQTRRRSRS